MKLKSIEISGSKKILIISQCIVALLSLVYGKLIAIYFTPKEFGVFNIQFAAYFLIFSVLVFPALQFFKTKNNNIENVKHTHFVKILLLLITISSSIIFIVFVILYNASLQLLMVVFFTLLFNILFILFNDYFNVRALFKEFSWSNIIKNGFMILLLLGIIFLINDSTINHETIWHTQLIGFMMGVVFFVKKYPWFLNGSTHSFNTFFSDYLRYSWPLMILAFWNWVNSYIDRYIIDYFLGLEEVGIYNANLGLGSKFFLILSPIFLALLNPTVFDIKSTVHQKKQKINTYVLYFLAIGFIILLVLFFTDKMIGRFLLSSLYSDGFYIIFWSAFAYFIITITYLYELLFYAENKTKIILIGTVISAIIYVLLNFVLIPKFQLYGVIGSLIFSTSMRFLYLRYQYNRYN